MCLTLLFSAGKSGVCFMRREFIVLAVTVFSKSSQFAFNIEDDFYIRLLKKALDVQNEHFSLTELYWSKRNKKVHVVPCSKILVFLKSWNHHKQLYYSSIMGLIQKETTLSVWFWVIYLTTDSFQHQRKLTDCIVWEWVWVFFLNYKPWQQLIIQSPCKLVISHFVDRAL